MSRVIEADYSQPLLLPPSLEDWVGPEHPARFVRAFVERLALDELGIGWNAGLEGRPTYGARLLLSVWLYGYYAGIRSTRKLEAACREQMGFLWLTGMHAPDHNTLWRFFAANREGLRRLFEQSVKVAVDMRLVGMVLHALDGTKIGAQPATATGFHRDKLETLLGRLDAIVEDWEAQVEATAAPEEPGTGLPEALQDEARLRAEVAKALEALDAAGENHLHPEDPDARVMKCPDINAKRFAYNSQAVVDQASGLIVAQDVTNEATDLHQLTPMLDRVEQTLGACAQTTVADAGYAAGRSLHEAQARDRNVLVNLPNRLGGHPTNPYHASHFTYDAQADTVVCPRGEALPYKHTRMHRGKGYPLRLYRCENKTCPVRAQCTRERKGRGIELTPYHNAIARQRENPKIPERRAALAKRRAIVECVFGSIKHNAGFRRYTVRGMHNVKAQWALVCTAYNLRKLHHQWLRIHPSPTPQPA